MKNFKWICLITALLALVANDVWARGGQGGVGGGGHSIGGGGHSFSGGRGRHFSGGRHFRGHRHFRGGFGFRGHRHFRGGFFNHGFGYGGFRGYGRYGGFGYRGYPSTVIVPSAPPVYIQRETVVTPVQQQTNYWHYCRNPDGYYPYVKQCPGGWLQVAPQPTAS